MCKLESLLKMGNVRKSMALLCFGLLVIVWPGALAHAQEANGIVAPTAEGIVSGMVTIQGVAQHDKFRKWQIDLLINGDEKQTTFLALDERPAATLTDLKRWDTTPFPNGKHVLRLRVVHTNLNYEEHFTPITILNSGAPLPVESGDTEATAPQGPQPLVFRTDAPPDGRRWIEIDISDQTLTAWQGDVPVFQTSVSTGKSGYRTLPGTFHVYVKHNQTRMIGPGYDTPDVPWTMYYYGGFAIHGAYWHNNFGTPVSHGCVNMRVPEAKALFDWASVGAEVVVHE